MILQIGKKAQIRPAGFTLIELVIVAAIILVLVAISTPLFRHTFRDLELRDAAYNISKMIQYAQQRAVIEEKKYRLLFDFNKKAYRLLVWNKEKEADNSSAEGAEGARLPAGQEPASGWKEVTGRFGGYFYLPEGVRFRGDRDKITFLPNGRCDKASLYITNKENKTFEIKTTGRTGYVEIFEVEQK